MESERLSLQIGKLIKELRKSSNLTLKILSTKTGLPTSKLSAIERGKIDLYLYDFEKICKALNFPPLALLKRAEV